MKKALTEAFVMYIGIVVLWFACFFTYQWFNACGQLLEHVATDTDIVLFEEACMAPELHR